MDKELFQFLSLSVGPVIIIGVGALVLKILHKEKKSHGTDTGRK